MKERPILFNGPMVRAILDGRKTQTRRVAKINLCERVELKGKQWNIDDPNSINACPYGIPGDRLWVRETWAHNGVLPLIDRPAGDFIYRADLNENGVSRWAASWKPSIHMPRFASRINLEITGVRVERLQDISEDDAKSEGISCVSKDGSLYKYGISDRDGLPGNDDFGWHWHEWEIDPRLAYKKLWEQINSQGSWDKNPWVWVVEFKRVSP